jgi:hypothetical protein
MAQTGELGGFASFFVGAMQLWGFTFSFIFNFTFNFKSIITSRYISIAITATNRGNIFKCVCVAIWICVYIYVYVHVYVYLFVYEYVYMYAYEYVYGNVALLDICNKPASLTCR